MDGFEFLEHTADLKFRATGKSLGECFENSARALWTSILKPESVTARDERKIKLESESLEVLLHDFLSELLFLFETEGLVFNEFGVEIQDGYGLKAVAVGERFNPEVHRIETEVKAVTYHEMMIEEVDGGWSATVLCDI